MALADQRGEWFPAVITGFIAAILGIWRAWPALSGRA
jgi:hypothetical protein